MTESDRERAERDRGAPASRDLVRRRVVVLAHEFPVASETFVVDHVEGLRRAGWEPIVVCGAVDPARLRALGASRPEPRVEVLAGPRPRTPSFAAEVAASLARGLAYSPGVLRAGAWMLARAALLERTLRRLAPALVHAHFAENGMCAALAVRGRIPVLVDFHGHDLTVLPLRIGWGVIRRTLRDCSLVAHSAFAAGRVGAGLGRRPAEVQLGVDPALFRCPPRPSAWPRPVRWLVVGRLEEKKGQHVALRALAVARRDPRQGDPELTLAGQGARRGALEELAAELGVSAHVRFTGELAHADVARQMAEADVLLVPSVPTPDGAVEAFGRVALEGLACGLPVVASDLGGLPEAVGDAGWLARPGDPEALAAAVGAALAAGSPAMYAERSRARAQSRSNERMWAEYDAVARAASASGPRGG